MPEELEPGQELRACEVCKQLDDDTTPKPVRYCGMCEAWMCEPCRQAFWTRRVPAALVKGLFGWISPST